MDSLSSTIEKSIGLINQHLELIQNNMGSQTNVADQLRNAGELASIVSILVKAQAAQDTHHGQEAQAQDNQATTEAQKPKKQTSPALQDIFNASE
jgi:hypothetical protein